MRYQAFFIRLETRVVINDMPIATAVYDSSLMIFNQSEFMDSGFDLAVSLSLSPIAPGNIVVYFPILAYKHNLK